MQYFRLTIVGVFKTKIELNVNAISLILSENPGNTKPSETKTWTKSSSPLPWPQMFGVLKEKIYIFLSQNALWFLAFFWYSRVDFKLDCLMMR